jgi:prolipoprotein diacylglyceryl transferase
VWELGPIPLRAYALCILLGVVVATYVADRRLKARGGPAGTAVDVAVWAVPAGIVGARIYHVLTSPQLYFGAGGSPVEALYIWNGGLGIWGGIAGGAVGAWIACRRHGIPLRIFADCAAPGLALAQAVGRWGNWFNQELYGRPSTLPWAVEIDPAYRPAEGADAAASTFHPTFLYESLWCVGVAVFVVWAERRWQLGRGRVFMLYVMAYTVGRAWIEHLRIDEANQILGLRLNEWTCLVVFLGALAYFLLVRGARERLETDADGEVRVVEDSPGPTDLPADGAEATVDAEGGPDRSP